MKLETNEDETPSLTKAKEIICKAGIGFHRDDLSSFIIESPKSITTK